MVKLVDQLHVPEQRGVAGMIDLESILKLDDIASSQSAINQLISILDAARVVRLHHVDVHVEHHLAAADAHGSDALYALLLHPHAQLKNADHHSIVFLG